MSEEVKENCVQIPSDEAADLVVKICALYVMPHFKEEYETGLKEVEALEDGDAKLARAKDLLATCVFNHHVNTALAAFIAEKEREKNSNSGSDSDGVGDADRVR